MKRIIETFEEFKRRLSGDSQSAAILTLAYVLVTRTRLRVSDFAQPPGSQDD